MQSLRFEDGKLKLVETRLPDLPDTYALIKVSMAGICATDIEITKGYMNFAGTLGHEFVGVVERCEDMPELEHKRVVGEINLGCGYCDWCKSGLSRHCPERTVLGISGLDGSFAEFLQLPTWNLHVVPDSIEDRAAVFTEPLAAAFEILEQVHLRPGAPVLLIGDGRFAQLVARVLSRAGCMVEAVGRIESKVRRMKGHVAKGYLNTPPPGRKYPVVVEASGSPKGWRVALQAVEPRGTIVLKSTYHGSMNFNPATLVVNEVKVIGSRCGPFLPAIKALESGLKVTDLVDAEFPLSQWEEAFKMAIAPDTLKVIFNMEESTA